MPPKDTILKIRLPHDLKMAAEQLAEDLGESLSMVVRSALRHYLDHYTDDLDAQLDDLTGSDAKPYPVLSAEQAEAMAELIRASQKLQDVAGSYDPRERTARNGEGI